MAAGVRVTDLGCGVLQVTHPLPWALDHVHCYLVRERSGATVIDCGLGTPAALAAWRRVLGELGQRSVDRLVVTHYHPDHLGGAAGLAQLAGVEEVVQGALDANMAREVWGPVEGSGFRAFLEAHGMPQDAARRSVADDVRGAVGLVEPTRLVEDGDRLELAGEVFDVLVLPGHADGHIALLGRTSGRLFGGDVLLREITPNVSRWPGTAPGPLGRYLETLERLQELSPELVYPGHGPVITDAAARAAEIRAHHEERLHAACEALRAGPRTAWEVAQAMWPQDALDPHEQRFALGEALAHLERLAAQGAAQALDGNRFALRV